MRGLLSRCTPTEIPPTSVFDLRTPTEISRTCVFDLCTPTEISRTSVFDLCTPPTAYDWDMVALVPIGENSCPAILYVYFCQRIK